MSVRVTSRKLARAQWCPVCRAQPEDQCVGRRGRARKALHAERHEAAIAAGAPVMWIYATPGDDAPAE